MRPDLWPHQREALAFVDGKPAAMLAICMGGGKSRVVVDLLAQRKAQTALIFCPSSVVDVWPGQFQTHSDSPYHVLPLRKGSVKHRMEQAQQFLATPLHGLKVVVINYDAVSRQNSPFAAWALKQKWDALIADEVHKIKSPGGVTSRYMSRLAKNIPFRLGLTGTPMPHSPLDIYGQYRMLDPTIFGTSFNWVKNRYAVQQAIPMGFTIIKGYRVDPTDTKFFSPQLYQEFQEKFYRIAFRVEADVLELPEPLHLARSCELSPAAMRQYQALEKDFYAEVDQGIITASNALVKALRLQQVASGFGRTEDGAEVELDTSKRELLKDIIEDLGEPVVVFCRFRHDLDSVRQVAQSLKLESRELSGRMNQLAEWQRGDAPVLAVQIQAGGVGIDLTRARVGVYYSLGLSLGDHLQSLARIHRPGQTRNVVYYYLLADRTIDHKVYQALQNRQEVIEAVMRR
jgi:SNF2 family DNA or RNA helicase